MKYVQIYTSVETIIITKKFLMPSEACYQMAGIVGPSVKWGGVRGDKSHTLKYKITY